MGYYILFPNHTWVCRSTAESALACLQTALNGVQGAIIVDATHPSNVMDINELKRFCALSGDAPSEGEASDR